MKKILMVIVLLLASFIVSALDYSDFEPLLNKNLTVITDVEITKLKSNESIVDFSKPFVPNTDFPMKSYKTEEENGVYVGFNTDGFYNLDFAADPFDGKIQIYVMGEPLPSPTTTMICALGVIGILLYCKKKKEAKLC